jgi:hypothetical protein
MCARADSSHRVGQFHDGRCNSRHDRKVCEERKSKRETKR